MNRSEKEIDCIICREGGIEIEEIADNPPEKIHKIPVSEKIIKEKKRLLEILSKIFGEETSEKFFQIIEKMFELFIRNDCSLVEINPLVLDQYSKLIALDAKIVIDDNALFKHPELEEFQKP